MNIQTNTGQNFINVGVKGIRYNTTYTLKRGAAGRVMTVTFYDERQTQINLYNKEIFLTAKKGEGDAAIKDMRPEVDQSTNTAGFTFGAAEASLPAGTYNFEITMVDSYSGAIDIFPASGDASFGQIIILESLG